MIRSQLGLTALQQVPRDSYGCTFCHNNPANTEMKGVLDHFSMPSRHPIGEKFNGFGVLRGTTTRNNMYLSNFNFNTAQSLNELECLDCHFISLVLPIAGDIETGHVTKGTGLRIGNPYMLRSVTALGEFDAFCRSCHDTANGTNLKVRKNPDGSGGTSTGVNVALASHNDGRDPGANAIKESDGTLLKTGGNTNAECTVCHKGHGSTRNKLFLATIDPSDSSKCTTCHQDGDAEDVGGIGNFRRHGHGKATAANGATLNFNCGNCHGVNSAHDPSNTLINTGDGNQKMFTLTADTATSEYGKSLQSVCTTSCHATLKNKIHKGDQNKLVGCIDCHDEHAEGSGAASNNYMIPQNLPNNHATPELSFFQSAGDTPPGKWDYWVDNNDGRKLAEGGAMAAELKAGFCDNSVCHVSTPAGSDLGAFLNSVNHTGGIIAPANVGITDCSLNCHVHTDAAGAWRAQSSCTSCHGQPPVSQATSAPGYVFSLNPTDESLSPHKRHASALADGGYGFACKACHFMNATEPPHEDGNFKSVYFDIASNPRRLTAYPTVNTNDYDGTTYTCNNLYCHSDGMATAASEKDGVRWMLGTSTKATIPTCEGCHGNTNVNASGTSLYGSPDHANGAGSAANSHAAHSAYPCAVCHNDTTLDMDYTDGWTLDIAAGKHVNGTKDLANGGGYTFTPGLASVQPRTCASISCHGLGGATWGGAALNCDSCHLRTNANGGDLNNFTQDGIASQISSEEYFGATSAGHGRLTASGAYPSGRAAANFTATTTDVRGCLYCHDGAVPHATPANPFRLRNKNALTRTAPEDGGWNDNCLICHAAVGTFPAAVGVDPDIAGTNYTIRNTAITDVNESHYGGSHNSNADGGTFCWDCHDPHGDTLHYEIHVGDGTSAGKGVTMTSDGTYGIPQASRTVGSFDVVAGGYTSADLANASFNGLCQTCHAPAAGLPYDQDSFTVLNTHNGADTTRCSSASCHPHGSDFAPSCSGCHGNPPPNSPPVGSGTTQTWVSDKSATPASVGEHTNHDTYVTGSCNSTCHVNTSHTLANATTANMGVKNPTAAASTGIYKYSTTDTYSNWVGGASVGITSVIDDTCTNTACHNSTWGAPANTYLSAANPTYTRYWNQNLNCYSCHAYDGSASAPRPSADVMSSGSHTKHVSTGGYDFACTDCHANNVGNNSHKNGSVNFTGNFGATRNAAWTGGTYDVDGVGWTPWTGAPAEGGHSYFCGNVICHSSGLPRNGGTRVSVNTARWTLPATGACGTCHTVTGSVLATNRHPKHTGSAADQYGYTCQTCHFTVVDGANAIIAGGFLLHVDGTNNAAFAPNAGTYAYTGGTVGAAGGTCTATYCHSKGLDFSAPYTGTNTVAAVPADWDIAVNGLGCFGCHGDGSAIAYPTYLNDTSIMPAAASFLKKNSHAKHSAFGCQVCHSLTTTTGNTITTKANHATGGWQVSQPAAGYTFTVSGGTLTDVAYTPVSCNTISCHGNQNAIWGQTLTCYNCHAGAETAATKPAVDTVANPVNQAQYEAQGHGQAGAFPGSGVTGPGFSHTGSPSGCYNCHDEAAQHAPAANGADPFRLGAYATNTDGLCAKAAGCHNNPAENQTHKQSLILLNGTWLNNYDFKCVDCHDPHGDGNFYMIRASISAPTAIGDTGANSFGSDSYGTPQDTANSSPITFISLAGNAADSYGVDGLTDGICEVCHVDTTNVTYYLRDGGNNSHNPTGKCSSCHAHKDGFKPSGCNSCHGGKLNTVAALNFYPDSNPGTAYADRAGAHFKHVTAIAAARASSVNDGSTCLVCHPSPGAGTHHDPNEGTAEYASSADVWNDGSGAYNNGSFGNAISDGVDANGAFSQAAKTCSNIDCHGGTTTPAWYAVPAPDATAPAWAPESGITVVDDGTGTSATASWSAAIDAYPTNPLKYDLFRSTSLATLFDVGNRVFTDLAVTSQQVTGLTAATTYYFGVRVKDSVGTPNVSANTDFVSLTTSSAPGNTLYHGRFQAAAYNVGPDGSTPTIYAAKTTPVIGMALAQTTAAGANQREWVQNLPTVGVWYRVQRFYFAFTSGTPSVGYTGNQWVGPNATGTISLCSTTATTDQWQLKLVDYDPTTGASIQNGVVLGESVVINNPFANATCATGGTAVAYSITFPRYQLPKGHLLVLEAWGKPAVAANDFGVSFGAAAAGGAGVSYFTTINIPQYAGDQAAPAWATTSGIAAANAATGGTVNVSWNAATDAYPSDPVKYNVYANTAGGTAVFTAPLFTIKGVTDTSVQFTGLTNSTGYFFGVRAVDSAPAPNESVNIDITGAVTPTTPGVGQQYRVNLSAANNVGADGALDTAAVTTRTYGSVPNYVKHILVSGAGTAAATTSGINGGFPIAKNWYMIDRFYFDAAVGAPVESFTSDYWIGPNLSGGSITVLSAATDQYLVRLVDYDPNSTLTGNNNGVIIAESAMLAGSATALSRAFTMTFPRYYLRRPHLLTLEVWGSPAATTANMRVLFGNAVVANASTYFTVPIVAADATAPTYATSGIAVSNPGVGGKLNITWNSTTDAGSPPVRYDLYRSTVSAGDVWNKPYVENLVTNAYTDTRLTDGTTYYYGVRAKDSNPVPNISGNSDTASGVPSGPNTACDTCHAIPRASGMHAKHANNDIDFADCDKCHPGSAVYAPAHSDGNVDLSFSGGATSAVRGAGGVLNIAGVYVDATADSVDNGTCSTTQCHGTASPVWNGTVTCDSCHSVAAEVPPAPTVTTGAAHLKLVKAGGDVACTVCHSGHKGGVMIPLPPTSWSNANLGTTNMRTALGINYIQPTSGGINLGGPGTDASIVNKQTEAEICWGCHNATTVSEFGFNADTITTAGYPVVASTTFVINNDTLGAGEEGFNFGWLYTEASGASKTQDWVAGSANGGAAFWRSPYDKNLVMRVASVHSANFDPAGQRSSVSDNVKGDGNVNYSTPRLETAADIRCSYCHDVHNTGPAPSVRPYLRGTWVGNPYPPDMPPRSEHTYPSANGPNNLNNGMRYFTGMAVPTPRMMADNPINDATSASRGKGGFFIDQNSNNPPGDAAMDTYNEVGGLCQVCHGTNVDKMDYYASASLWRTSQGNGHSNAALGGTGIYKSNLFDARRGATGAFGTGGRGMMGQQGMQGTNNPFGSDPGEGTAAPYGGPLNMAGTIPRAGWWENTTAGLTTGQTATVYFLSWFNNGSIGKWNGPTDSYEKPHRFLCSKCHSPHATGMPALLTTNCLDRRIATWTAQPQAAGTIGPNGSLTPNAGTTATSCHVKNDTMSGWHRLAPNQQYR